jgi:ATP-dependent RNA helicase RhlE
MSFSTIGLSPAVMNGVAASGYQTPTEIQRKAIPAVLAGRDVIGCAPTGTGKTAAFVLPMLSRLEQSQPAGAAGRIPRALILTPTRELCQQIEDAIRCYGQYSSLRSVSIYGGAGMGGQLARLREGVDIVVATPGRLLDHLQRGSIALARVEILVLDEADRMFDMGFIAAVRSIIAKTPATRQTLLFSATMSREVRSLVSGVQKSPEVVDVGTPFSPAATVDQHFYQIPQQSKMDLLLHVLEKTAAETMLVFSRTKHGADKIARRLLQKGISSAAIHSNRSQSQRQAALEGFKNRRHQVLVATDLAARGIDVSGIAYVVNYDTPAFAEDYIHRIGRTGRAEEKGSALTFVSNDEQKYVKRIEYLTGKRFPMKEYPGFSYPSQQTAPAAATAAGGLSPFRKRRYYRTPRFA